LAEIAKEIIELMALSGAHPDMKKNNGPIMIRFQRLI
jgi:hypothetical protein